MEKIILSSRISQAKIIGTIVSISGALIVVLYAGPALVRPSSPSDALGHHALIIPRASDCNQWVLGGLLLAVNWFLLSIWLIFQTRIVSEYPAELVVVFLFSLCSTVIYLPACFLLESSLNKWKLRADVSLLAVLVTGVGGNSLGTAIQIWCLYIKGPVYVTSFKPLSVAIAAFGCVIFLGDTLYLGCVVGATVVLVGFYGVLWGKAKETKTEEGKLSGLESPCAENAPLLQRLGGNY